MPKFVGIISLIAGIVLIVSGAVTWGMVTSQLKEENITIPGDARWFAGQKVGGPFTAFSQADIINTHALNSSDGHTYAELGGMVAEAREAGNEELAEEYQAQRNQLMNASFLRASLFTSVVSYGVAALVMGLGVMFGLVGAGFLSLTRRPAVAAADAA